MKINDVKSLPVLLSDADAEEFIATSDLTKFDLSGGRLMNFEFEEKDSQLSLRMPTRDRKSTRLNSSHGGISRMPSSA